MAQDEAVDFKTLRAKFQNDEAFKIQIKPAIPEKPKALTSPTTKISNPLVASLNTSMMHHMSVVPRVVFKEEKKSTGKSQPEVSQLNVDEPQTHLIMPDKKQKKAADTIKTLKDMNLPLVLPVSPVTPVIQESPKCDPVPTSPVSTPKKKSIFNFRKSASFDKEKTDKTSKTAKPVVPVLDGLVPSSSAHVNVTPIVNEPVAPKALVPPVQKHAVPSAAIPPPAVPETEAPVLTVIESDIVSQITPEAEISRPECAITHNLSVTAPEPDVQSPQEVTHSSEIPDILDIVIPPPVIPEDVPDADISALVISAPATPDPSIPAHPTSASQNSSSPKPSHTASPAPLTVTPEPSDTLVQETVTPDSVTDSHPRMATIVQPSAIDVVQVMESAMAESEAIETEKSLQTTSALSALARAEEMSPRHSSCDQRVLKILERAKRKHAMSHQPPTPTTPEIITLVETAPPAFAHTDVSTAEKAQTEAAQTEPIPHKDPSVSATPDVLPLAPTTDISPLVPAADISPLVPTANISPLLPTAEVHPTDYDDQGMKAATVESKSPTSKTALSNVLDHGHASPIPNVPAVQTPAKAGPPPPPPRKHFPAVSKKSSTPEKPENVINTDLQTSILLDQPVEHDGRTASDVTEIIPAPMGFTTDVSKFEDLHCEDSFEVLAHEAPQFEDPEYENSVHAKAFLEQLNPAPQSPKELYSNVETTEPVSEIQEQQTGDRKTGAAELPDSVPDSPVIPTPLGTCDGTYNDADVYEDVGTNNKIKTQKKLHKAAPMNPYADSHAVNEEASRKTLFSRKNASPDEKELKKKEKQKEKAKGKKEKKKEKEKEMNEHKEKELKEQKEKEKEKKEEKEKEREKKEHKEKEKEKKEQKVKEKEKEHKEKEKEKKDNKDKEREKKEQKEKDREKKEQKEKEKKENEIKKKFKIRGEEEVLYQAKVMETSKGRKNDLAVKAGETISVIRTADCPKGKWLARDSNNKYGYISVESVEMDIQEMMQLGKKAKASNSNGFTDPEVTSTGSRSSSHYPLHHESFTDDSEEWCDDDDTLFTPTNTDLVLNKRVSSLEEESSELDSAQPRQTDANDNILARQEALQKLATFFAQPKMPGHATLNRTSIIEAPAPALSLACTEEPLSISKQDVDLQILPPPNLYADIIDGDSEDIYWN